MSKVLLYELGKSISFGRLPLLGKVLWPMLLAASDNQGRGLAEADVIKWTVCANVNELTPDNIPGVLGEMAQQEMLHLYTDSRGRQLYQVLRWWEYQDLQWAQPSSFEPPPEWVDRARYQRKDVQTMQNWDKVGGFLDNGGGNTRPGAKDVPPASPPGTPPGEPPTDQAGPLKQSKAKQLNSDQSKATQSKASQTEVETPTKSQILPAAAPPGDDACFADALDALAGYGIDEPKAREITGTRGADWVLAWRDEFIRRGDRVHSPAAMIVSFAAGGTGFPDKPPGNGRGKDRRSIDGAYGEVVLR